MVYLNMLLVGVVAAMGFALVADRSSTVDAPAQAVQLPEGTATIEEVMLEFPDRAAFAAITERPLFLPDRRPLAGDETDNRAAPAPKAELPPPQVVLSGIVTIGEGRRALMALPREDAQLYATGQSLGGWRVSEITEDSVELISGARTHKVSLDDQPASQAGNFADPARATGRAKDRTRSRTRVPNLGLVPDMSEQID